MFLQNSTALDEKCIAKICALTEVRLSTLHLATVLEYDHYNVISGGDHEVDISRLHSNAALTLSILDKGINIHNLLLKIILQYLETNLLN